MFRRFNLWILYNCLNIFWAGLALGTFSVILNIINDEYLGSEYWIWLLGVMIFCKVGLVFSYILILALVYKVIIWVNKRLKR